MADLGTGSTITFGTSGFESSMNLLGLSGPNATRETLDTTHMGTTTARAAIPAALVDGGELTVELHFEGSIDPPVDAAAETITIDWGGAGLNHKWAFSGFMTNFVPTSDLEEVMTATATIKVSGGITIS